MTLAEKAYHSLRQDIVDGVFEPNAPLRLAQLRERYGYGFSPLREALTRLNSERLVVSKALKGFRVAPLSLSALQDTMQTRTFIECEALTRSIEFGDDQWEAEIVAKLHALRLQAERTINGNKEHLDLLESRHYEFHRALISACESDWLMEIFATLYVGSTRYRVLAQPGQFDSTQRDLDKEHTEIAEATLKRDVKTATMLLSQHYRKTADNLERLASWRNRAPFLF